MSLEFRGEDCVGDTFWKGQDEGAVEKRGRRKKIEDNQCLSGRKPQHLEAQ